MSSVGTEFPVEQKRVRELVEVYRGLPNPAGVFGALMLGQVLERAEQAQASGDVIAILRSYEELKGCQ